MTKSNAFRTAQFRERFAAFLIDQAIVGILVAIVLQRITHGFDVQGLADKEFMRRSAVSFALLTISIQFIYFSVAIAVFSKTLGKFFMGLEIITSKNQRISELPWQRRASISFLRAIGICTVGLLPFLFIAPMMFSKKREHWIDRALATHNRKSGAEMTFKRRPKLGYAFFAAGTVQLVLLLVQIYNSFVSL